LAVTFRPLQQFAFLTALIGLSACVSNDPNAARTVSGQYVGSAQWKDISAGESRLSFDNPPSTVLAYSERSFPTRVQQGYRLNRGVLLFEQSGTSEAFAEVNSRSLHILEAASTDSEFRARGISVNMDSVQRGRARFGPYAIAAASGNSFECNVFQLLFEGSVRNYDNGAMYQAYARGYWCGLSGETRDRVNSDTLALLQSIHFDGGALNRARGQNNPPAANPVSNQAPARQAAPPPATTPVPNAQPVTSGQSTRDAETRLRELNRLRDSGLITPQEYDLRRKAVLDGL